MAIKVTMFLQSDKYSWSEEHYYLPAQALPNAGLPAIQLMQLRAGVLGYGATVKLARLSLVPANGRVFDAIPTQPLAPAWPLPAPVSTQPVVYYACRPYQSLQVRMTSADGGHRMLYLGAAPTGLFHGNIPGDSGVDYSQVPGFQAALGAYLNFLTSQGSSATPWGWLSRIETAYIQAQGPLVTNAAFPGTVGVQTLTLPQGAAVGAQVQVKGWRRTSIKSGARLTGVYRVAGVLPPVAPANLFTVFLAGTAQVVPSNFFSVGQIAPYSPLPLGYAGATAVQAVERKRGATAYRPRGRSRTR